MEHNFTPGPWSAGGKVPYKGNECWIMDSSIPERLIADGSPSESSLSMRESHANCLLIAAAPEMFSALLEIIDYTECEASELSLSVLNKAKAAFNKALNG